MEKFAKGKITSQLIALLLLLGLSNTANAAIALDDYGFNVDGSISYPFFGDAIPTAVDVSGFNDITGLGTIEVTITGAGNHNFGAIFDHDIDETANTFFNEVGAVHGAAAVNQGWEIDEPFFSFIYSDFESDSLLVFSGNNSLSPDDVSMAMSWKFMLAQGERALITMALGTTLPGGFSLEQLDRDSNQSIFLSSTLGITSAVPVPAALWLFGSGLIGLIGFSRRKQRGM
jgi:hypothetical protein